MLAAKNYQGGAVYSASAELLAWFDFRLHAESRPDRGKILETLAEIKKLAAVVPSQSWGRFPYRFQPYFAGGYAAWLPSSHRLDVLAARCFLSRFEEEGIFNRETGKRLRQHSESWRSSEEPMDLFKRFRGREPQPDAMLEHYGISGLIIQ